MSVLESLFNHQFIFCQPIPYETGIPAGFGVGQKLSIYGTPEKKGRRFLVNLLRKNGDIALHFNPRFDEKVAFLANYFITKLF